MILLLLMALAAHAQMSNFTCLSKCRVPYFTCIQSGIPGHEIERLQKCVIDNRKAGKITQEECVKCIDETLLETDCEDGKCIEEATEAPTPEPATPEFCDKFSKRIKVCILPDNTKGLCKWNEENRKCVPGDPDHQDGEYSLDDLQPCLKTCQEYALECNFTHDVNQNNFNQMRNCAFQLAEKEIDSLVEVRPEHDSIRDCMSCMEDIFRVLGNPSDPPKEGFQLFNDYRRFIAKQYTIQRCKERGGKFIRRNIEKPGKCVLNKAKKLRCKKIKNVKICKAVGCNINKRGTCNGKNKWK